MLALHDDDTSEATTYLLWVNDVPTRPKVMRETKL